MGTNRPLVEELRRGFLTGVAVIVPLMVTIIVLTIAFNYVYQYLDLFSDAILPFSPRISVPIVGVIGREPLVEITTPFVLLLVILGVGLTVNSSRYGALAVDYFDYLIERVPGVGSVYESFRRMSDVMLDSDGENFQEVVLVEFPTEETYTLAFVTSHTPDPIADAADRGGEGMRTLFMPMAPNPVMGGHVLFVPESRIVDIDLTVEEGIQALVTSGVAIGDDVDGGGIGRAGTAGVSAETLQDLSRLGRVEQRLDPTASARRATSDDRVMAGRRERYDEAINPREAETPDAIVRRERDREDHSGDIRQTSPPAERADRRKSARAPTETPPSERAERDLANSDSTDVPPERHDDLDGEAADEGGST
ncbi:Uncharacterized membrane protein [Halopenitus malekzadehii]|uniref:Uncharacterized membrane protein n=1 Tax=Halopenitus malekzadehii TaxID=1267564 RepID=A0A1H6IP22_9EURY|nr:DUF502 domain-containing protein [Halopenitus malekzadehii]SEH48038.1 Uncharacterized membrane protein [Halopenitus malekzadehii]